MYGATKESWVCTAGSVQYQPAELASLFVYHTWPPLLRIYFWNQSTFWLLAAQPLNSEEAICLLFQPIQHLWPLYLMAASYGGMSASTKFMAVHQNGTQFVCTTSHESLCIQLSRSEPVTYMTVIINWCSGATGHLYACTSNSFVVCDCRCHSHKNDQV